MPEIDILAEGKKLFDVEIEAMELVKKALDKRFVDIVKLICDCKGKVVITGMGKPGHIGTKIAATMASLGTPSFFLHPAEAQHGDLGMLREEDIVIAISFSGESEEVTRLIPSLKLIGSDNENSRFCSRGKQQSWNVLAPEGPVSGRSLMNAGLMIPVLWGEYGQMMIELTSEA